MAYTGYSLNDVSRSMLKVLFPPSHDRFIGEHITEVFGVGDNAKLPKPPNDVKVIGYYRNNLVEFFTVSIDGKTDRPNGGKYHITWSINESKGAKPVDSNKYIELAEKIDPIPIEATPKLFK